jgi:hypothetical protein
MVHASITTFNLSLLQGYDDMWVIQVPFIGDRVGLLPPPRQCYVSTLQQPPHDLPPFSENDRPSIPMPAKCLCMCARAREREIERESGRARECECECMWGMVGGVPVTRCAHEVRKPCKQVVSSHSRL